MKTLIELYDERPIENVLASEVFRPERTVFLCPSEAAQDKRLKAKLKEYFVHRGLDCELIFVESSLYDSDKIAAQLQKLTKQYPDCVVDITGGTDAALFACGTACETLGIPTFTYSRRKNRFYDINNAPFADALPCTVQHKVEDCFMMAGGALRRGRADNAVLGSYMSSFDAFFSVYMRHRTQWKNAILYLQQASQGDKDAPVSLYVDAPCTVKGDHGARIGVPSRMLSELQDIGYLSGLDIGDRVKFRFKDQNVRNWLRDMGSVLELYVYKACVESELFNDVVSSAVVDWESDVKTDVVTNEIDVMAMHGVLPFFISCKNCDISTEALNELAILRDRFGGKGAKAAVVSTQRCRSITRHRASELEIDVIDLDDIKSGMVGELLAGILHTD